MKSLAYRLCIGLAGLGTFWALGMVSANELAKTTVLMLTWMFGLVGVFTLWKPRFAWLSGLSITVYLLFFFDAAIKGFLRSYYGLRPNHSMVLQSIFNTNSGEAQEFLIHNWRAIGQAAAVFAVIALLAVAAERYLSRQERKMPFRPSGRPAKATAVTMLVLFVALHFNPTMAKENPVLFWPLRYTAYQKQLAEVKAMQTEMQKNMAQRSEWHIKYAGEPKRTVVWIIGESINRANMSLYHYPRRTTPILDGLRDDLMVFNDVISPAAYTMDCMKEMLTPADLDHPDAWSKNPDLLMLAKEAGYKTFWLSNQMMNDGWVGLVSAQADQRVFINRGNWHSESNLDANLLPHFESALADQAPKKLIVVHLLGAHPTYDMRYPKEFSRFDGMADAVSQSLEKQKRPFWIRQSRDEYDNAILYSDYVVGSMIRSVAQRKAGEHAALLYGSDHGQEVGHYRDYAGHSPNDRSGYEIPMLIWNSEFPKRSPGAKAALENRSYQTDQLEHTMLGLLKINTNYYNAKQDILSDQFMPMPRRINGRLYVADSQLSPIQ